MTTVYMLSTRRGAANGFDVARYHEGQMYDLPNQLAASFIRAGHGIEIPEEDLPKPFRPQPVYAPHNAATLMTMGEDTV